MAKTKNAVQIDIKRLYGQIGVSWFTLTFGVDSTNDGLSVKLRGNVFSAREIVPRSQGTSGTM